MAEVGKYLFSNVGFTRDEQPILSFQRDDIFSDLLPIGKTITLQFDMSQRYCTGWWDMKTGERFTCPERNTVEDKYEQCATCQKRTGFNPAFYNASSVSEQQEVRNQEPHILYLAHFGKDIVKVGISHAGRGRSRLLEQGARSALILDTFPSAHIARQYEARIAALPGIAETIQLRKKILELNNAYDEIKAATELESTRSKIEEIIGIQFTANKSTALHEVFFPSEKPDLKDAYDCSSHHLISGNTIGMLGSLFFTTQQDTSLFIPLKKYIGYHVYLDYDIKQISLPARQISLF